MLQAMRQKEGIRPVDPYDEAICHELCSEKLTVLVNNIMLFIFIVSCLTIYFVCGSDKVICFSRTLQLHCNVQLLSWYVVCLSSACLSFVTLVYCDKTTEGRITQFSHKSSVRS